MSTFVGRVWPAQAVVQQPEEEAETKAEKTRAELIEEAEALGIELPPRAKKAQIQKLIDEAPVM